MTENDRASQLTEWIVGMMSPEAEPSPLRDYYLVLLRHGKSVPEAVGLSIDDLLEEVRSAVSREEPYNPRVHRARLKLPASVSFNPHRLPRPALVRRIAQERILGTYPGRRPARRERET